LNRAAALALCSLLAACAPTWKSTTLVDPRAVAQALSDPWDVDPAAFDPASVPVFDAPSKLRPCCAFGQDLKVEVVDVPVPLIKVANVMAVGDLGPHNYGSGALGGERNGLVYTCRGGFIDIAHVRDNADRALFLMTQIARALPAGVTVDMPEEGTSRRIVVAPLPAKLLARHGRWHIAAALAGYANHQLSNWHEIVTWYGFESTPGMPERMSAFSPEDIYSNTLGTKLAVGVVLHKEMRSREEYDAAMQAWMREALRRLGAVSKEHARAAMASVDGEWWDSGKRVPEFGLVTRRFTDISFPVAPWIVPDAPPECTDQPPALTLELPERLGGHKISELVTVAFKFEKWTPEKFPVPASKGDTVTTADFPTILKAIHEDGLRELGPSFNKPD
jgi:hypothetical protein